MGTNYEKLAEMVLEQMCVYFLQKTKDLPFYEGDNNRSMRIYNEETRALEKEVFQDGTVVKYD